MEIKRIPRISGDTVAIMNSRNVMSWMVKRQMIDYKKGYKSLTSDLRDRFFNEFGKHDSTLTLEFRYKKWNLSYKHLNFVIYSASGKGTCIELYCDMSEDDDSDTLEMVRLGKHDETIIEFLELLSETLNKESTVNIRSTLKK